MSPACNCATTGSNRCRQYDISRPTLSCVAVTSSCVMLRWIVPCASVRRVARARCCVSFLVFLFFFNYSVFVYLPVVCFYLCFSEFCFFHQWFTNTICFTVASVCLHDVCLCGSTSNFRSLRICASTGMWYNRLMVLVAEILTKNKSSFCPSTAVVQTVSWYARNWLHTG